MVEEARREVESDVRQVKSERKTQTQGKTCLWWFDETYWTDETEEEVRMHMKDDGYIEGLEWGFVRHTKIKPTGGVN